MIHSGVKDKIDHKRKMMEAKIKGDQAAQSSGMAQSPENPRPKKPSIISNSKTHGYMN